jgi:FkbM family methyltransferase
VRGRWSPSTWAEGRELRRREKFARTAADETSHVAVERHGALFILPIRQKAGFDRFLKPDWKEQRHLQRALACLERLGIALPGSVFVDVGAHIGSVAIAAVRRFGFARACAFEPERDNFRLLEANLAVNGLNERITTRNVAISNRVGSAELKIRPELGAKHRLADGDEPGATTVPVELSTLDALGEDGTLDVADTGLLWVDIEGHEVEALEGAETLRRRSVPIVVEFSPRAVAKEKIDELREMLAENYTHIVDLRRRLRGGRPRVLPLSELDQMRERYRNGFTDLLVFRQP